MIKFLNRFGFWISLVVCVVVYLALAYKNPFKDNSLISNLEPYPDTLLYSFPAWNWVRGNGWNLGVGEKIVGIGVPNTYGYLLVPLMWLFKDIRSFYLTNLIFGFGSLIFFILALRNFFGDKKWYLSGFLGFLLATNFYFFTWPQLVMAENINYFLVCVFIYLISLKFEWKHVVPMLCLSVFTLMVKQTNLVLGGSFALSFGIKFLMSQRKQIKINKILLMFLGIGLLAGVYYLPKILMLNNEVFNFGFLKTNFSFYLNCLNGGWCRNLWYNQKILSFDIVVLFILGFLLMLINKDKREQLLVLFLPILLLTLAMSVFRDTEGRHVEILVPLILVIAGFAINFAVDKVRFPILIVFGLLLVDLLMVSYQNISFESKLVSLKKQVGLNFRHREDPWNYICLEYVQDFMKDKPSANFGSFLPMFLFDAYGVNLNYLPLSAYQDFMLAGRGLQDYFSLPLKNIYQEKLNEGKEIYLSDYYASNGRDLWRNEWNEIVSVGKLEKVYQSPLDNCNIYKLVKSYKVESRK